MIRVAQVRRGSIGADLDIQVGSSLLRLNGEELRDGLDLQYLEAAELVELEVELPGGRQITAARTRAPSASSKAIQSLRSCGPRSTSRTMTTGSPSCTVIT
jgi:hypothetical protein